MCVCSLSVVSFADSCICSDLWSVLLIGVRTNSGRNFQPICENRWSDHKHDSKKGGGYRNMCDFNCFLLFLLISFDVQDVVIDVHDFRVCSKTHKNQWKMKGFIDYNGVVATENAQQPMENEGFQ